MFITCQYAQTTFQPIHESFFDETIKKGKSEIKKLFHFARLIYSVCGIALSRRLDEWLVGRFVWLTKVSFEKYLDVGCSKRFFQMSNFWMIVENLWFWSVSGGSTDTICKYDIHFQIGYIWYLDYFILELRCPWLMVCPHGRNHRLPDLSGPSRYFSGLSMGLTGV